MNPFLFFLLLVCSLFARAQETGKPVDYANPKAGDYIRVEGYLQDWCQAHLRPDLAFQLDDILNSMRLLPDWKFQVEVHTDCRAGHAYNDTFSQARADTLLNHMLSKGFPSWRLEAKGMGERKLLIEKCSCELTDYNNQMCSEPEHQLNRRTIIPLVEKVEWTGHEPLSITFASPGQFRSIPFDNSGDEAYIEANEKLWNFLDSLEQCGDVHFTLYHLPGKRALTKPFITRKEKKKLSNLRPFERIPSRMHIIHKQTGQSMMGVQCGFVILIDSIVSNKKIMAELGIGGDIRITVFDIGYGFNKDIKWEPFGVGGLKVPWEISGSARKYRLYIVTTDHRNCFAFYSDQTYNKWMACQDTTFTDYIGYSKRMREEFPDFPEIVEVAYLDIPDLKRPWMLILQPIKEE